MKLKEATKSDISGNMVESILDEFIGSEKKYAEIEYDEGTPGALSALVRRTARKRDIPISVVKRGERIFLINTEVEE